MLELCSAAGCTHWKEMLALGFVTRLTGKWLQQPSGRWRSSGMVGSKPYRKLSLLFSTSVVIRPLHSQEG